MKKNRWLFDKSFPTVVFAVPRAIMYGSFLAFVPIEIGNARPSLFQFTVGAFCAVTVMFVLVVIFSIIWTLLMRLFYGNIQVPEWLNEPKKYGDSRTKIDIISKIFAAVFFPEVTPNSLHKRNRIQRSNSGCPIDKRIYR